MFWLLKLRGSLVFEHWFAKILKKLKWKPLISSVPVQVGALGGSVVSKAYCCKEDFRTKHTNLEDKISQ